MIFGPFERLLAGRYLRARRAEGFVSVIAFFSLAGMTLGVGTLIVVMSVMGGFRTEFVSKILGLKPHIEIMGQGPVQDYEDVRAKVKALPGIVEVTPMVEGQALLTLNGYATGLVVKGLSTADFKAQPAYADHIVAGKPDDFTEDQVAIGLELASQLGLKVGDTITLLSPKLTSTPFGSMPRKGTFTVGVIFNPGLSQFSSGLLLMPLEAAQGFFQTGDGVTEVGVNIADPEKDITRAHVDIFQALGARYRVIDWTQENQLYLNTLDTEKSTMFLILTMIILVAAFNIISSLIMLVKDKNADIAILRTMGATRGMIMRIFFMAGAAIGALGSALGVVIAVLFVKYIEDVRHFLERIFHRDLFPPALYLFSQIPAKIDWFQVGYVVVIALVMSFIFSIIPAWRASRVDPVEALRYE
ncbi:MAG TPA: lipoprotein-releasing ABC transporter permease subunit [Alphaproteobacteria bacterium]|jgi:lipoprotein-releasing system permease protein|nr:lipoprotein-releasing ABC transporter permease subunit [Alphaproteobacteria bacterium]